MIDKDVFLSGIMGLVVGDALGLPAQFLKREEVARNPVTGMRAGYGMPADFGGIILRYNSTATPTAGTLYDLKQYFDVAYLTPDSKSMKSTFAPYFSYLIKDVASNSEKEDGWSGYVVSMSQSTHPLSLSAYGKPKFLIGNWNNSSATWTVDNELTYTSPYLKKISTSYAGMLDFPLRTFMYNIEQGTYKDASAAGWQALTKMSQMMTQYGSRIELVLANNDDMALGAIDALRQAGITEGSRPAVFGIDGTKEGLQAIVDGTMAGTVYHDKEGQAMTMAKLAAALYDGEDLSSFHLKDWTYCYLPYQKVTPENLEKFLER